MIALLINGQEFATQKEIVDYRREVVEVTRAVPPPSSSWMQPYRRSRRRGGGTTYYDIYGGVVFISRGNPLHFTFTFRSARNGRGCQTYPVPQEYFAGSSRVRYRDIPISGVPACFTSVQGTECHLIIEYADGMESKPMVFEECPDVKVVEDEICPEVCNLVGMANEKLDQLLECYRV